MSKVNDSAFDYAFKIRLNTLETAHTIFNLIFG